MVDDALKLENQICFPLYAVSRLIIKLYQPILSEYDLTYPQYLVFLLLWEKDQRTVSDIGNCLYLESNTLTPLLKRLESKGYIVRSRSTEDERSVIIKLTKRGNHLQEKLSTMPDEILKTISAENISQNDIVHLKQTVKKITEAIL